MEKTCAWYLLCANAAIGTTPHPVLGAVAICQRCASKHDLPVTPFPADSGSVANLFEISTYRSDRDGAAVVEIDTGEDIGRVRINLNDGTIWNADPNKDDVFGALRKLLDNAEAAADGPSADAEHDAWQAVGEHLRTWFVPNAH